MSSLLVSLLWEIFVKSVSFFCPSRFDENDLPQTIFTSSDRYLVEPLTSAGHTLVTVDHRGLGESDTSFSSYNPENCGDDIVLLMHHLCTTWAAQDNKTASDPIFYLMGNSYGGAAIVWAAADCISKSNKNKNHKESPSSRKVYPFVSYNAQIGGIILIDAFVRDHAMPFGVMSLLWALCNSVTGPAFWASYYQSLYTVTPSPVEDLVAYTKGLKKNLKGAGRMYAAKQQLMASKAACAARLPELQAQQLPSLVLFGAKDPDFAVANEGKKKGVPIGTGCEREAIWIVDQLSGQKQQPTTCYYNILPEAGHYPHVELPTEVAQQILQFLQQTAVN